MKEIQKLRCSGASYAVIYAVNPLLLFDNIQTFQDNITQFNSENTDQQLMCHVNSSHVAAYAKEYATSKGVLLNTHTFCNIAVASTTFEFNSDHFKQFDISGSVTNDIVTFVAASYAKATPAESKSWNTFLKALKNPELKGSLSQVKISAPIMQYILGEILPFEYQEKDLTGANAKIIFDSRSPNGSAIVAAMNLYCNETKYAPGIPVAAFCKPLFPSASTSKFNNLYPANLYVCFPNIFMLHVA
jgi:hypothetical protein